MARVEHVLEQRVRKGEGMSVMTILAAGAVTLCAQFSAFPDNTTMGASFELSGYVFRDLGTSPSMFVNETGGEHGLQFKPTGIAVALPAAVNAVDLRVGAFSGPVTVRAKNASGTVVSTQTVPGINRYVDIRVVGADIAAMELTDGGGEGLLARICTALSVCGCK
jgi:hypothetical protein